MRMIYKLDFYCPEETHILLVKIDFFTRKIDRAISFNYAASLVVPNDATSEFARVLAGEESKVYLSENLTKE